MRILLDTSALGAAMVEAHPAHKRSLARVKRVKGDYPLFRQR